MDQIRFEWAEPRESRGPSDVALDRELIDAALTLMTRALIAVVRGALENDDER
jgi:hypothetical protein